MIAPDVKMVDLDPVGFGWVCSVITRRDRARRSGLTVLHESGHVVRVVHSTDGDLDAWHEPFANASERAHELLALAGVEEVTMLDRSGLDDLSAALVDAARRSPTQPEMLWACADAYRSHPAVALAPEREPSPWPAIAAAARSLGPHAWVDLVAHDDSGDVVTRLTAELRDGVVVLLTSTPPAMEPVVHVDIAQRDLEAALLAPDPLAHLRDLADDGLLEGSTGLERLP